MDDDAKARVISSAHARALDRREREPFIGMHYRLQPDYSRPLFEVPERAAVRLRRLIAQLYGGHLVEFVYGEVERQMRVHVAYSTDEILAAERAFDPRRRFTERDAVLITYGDLVVSENRPPLRTLADFTEVFFRGLITTVHILPFYPYSSDRGFSVISYEEVDPALGSWDEIAELEATFKLMFDGVFNHVSARSYWFQEFINGNPEYLDYFTAFARREDVDAELRSVLRPRTSDLLTRFDTIHGPRWVWTTFSADQVDLNFHSPKVLLKVLEIVLYYVRRGADLLRLDALTYLWDEVGTTGANLPQDHCVVKLFRAVLDVVAPHVALVTETNVPHADNVTYFGDGWDEAQMVYNFALPPLVLHTFLTGDATTLTTWAATLAPPSEATAFFNFLDSHDGIGLAGARGILSEEDIASLCRETVERGGFVSSRTREGGGETPYELNITWFSALNRAGRGEPVSLQVDRFIASRAIALALRGVPGIYLPSMFGARNDAEAAVREGSMRGINRATMREESLFEAISAPESVSALVAERFLDLLERRISTPAFHPAGAQRVLEVGPGVFAVVRTSPDRSSTLLCLTSVVPRPARVTLMPAAAGLHGERLFDVLTEEAVATESGRWEIPLAPYQVRWLKVRARLRAAT